MRITVQLFARLRELAGRDVCEIDVPEGASVGDVWQALAAEHPALEPFGASVSCAVNADFAKRDARVRAGDSVAFLPPVSGGDGSIPA
jgi:molybdopterin converting factor subunit 1